MKHRACPVWMAYLLACPIRRLGHDPDRILGPYVRAGMQCSDLGCAMGFFSLPLARLVGPGGCVVCVDLRSRMIEGLMRRARRSGFADRIEARVCGAVSLGLDDLAGQMDFALAFAVVHETPEPGRFLREASEILKPGGRLLTAEPKGHVSATEFARTVGYATGVGLRVVAEPQIWGVSAVLLERTV